MISASKKTDDGAEKHFSFVEGPFCNLNNANRAWSAKVAGPRTADLQLKFKGFANEYIKIVEKRR